MATHRRGFLARCSAAAATLGFGALTPRAAHGLIANRTPAMVPNEPEPGTPELARAGGSGEWDHSWLERLTGPYRQIFDVPKHLNGGPLNFVNNYITAFEDVHGARPGEVQAVLGLHGGALPMAFGHELWAKYKVGESIQVDDPITKERALRNPWFREEDPTHAMAKLRLAPLQERGMIVLLCGNVLRGWAGSLARSTEQQPEDVRAELEAGLIPGAIVVPAMVAAFQQAQARGCSYVYASA